jgi:hypothetical protein
MRGPISLGRAHYSFLALLAGLAFILGWRGVACKQQFVPGTADSDRALAPTSQPEQALQAEIDRCAERISSKMAVVEQVIAGELTLHQAAARFEELDATKPPQLLAFWRMNCVGDTDEERYCWTILRFSAGKLRDRPSEVRAFRERVEGELPENLRRRLAEDFLSTQWDVWPRSG